MDASLEEAAAFFGIKTKKSELKTEEPVLKRCSPVNVEDLSVDFENLKTKVEKSKVLKRYSVAEVEDISIEVCEEEVCEEVSNVGFLEESPIKKLSPIRKISRFVLDDDAIYNDYSPYTDKLIYQIENGGKLEIIRDLIEEKMADPNCIVNELPLIIYACLKSMNDVVKYLCTLEEVELLVEDENGRNALMLAAKYCELKTIRSLLLSGSDILTVDDNGKKVYQYAKQWSKNRIYLVREYNRTKKGGCKCL
jgi:hypothetical protein